jgi:hypothetical protein
MSTPAPFNSYKVFAIIATVVGAILNFLGCCCLPACLGTGITAIVFASKAERLMAQGEEAAAQAAANTAKLWSWITAGLGALFGAWFVISLVINLMGYSSSGTDFRQILEEIQKHR